MSQKTSRKLKQATRKMRSSVIDVMLLFLIILRSCKLQKTSGDNKRHDVYIAGFFPFGKGVENSETGRKINKIS